MILTTVILTSFISGCIGGGQFGAPSADSSVTIKGVVVAPDNDCFTDTCANPSIIEGDPLPNADIILKGDTHTLTGKTDCAGNYQISGLADDGYILYANRGEVWVKKAISPVTGDGGQANYLTTAQVILWEVIESSSPGSIPIKDIPTVIPFDGIPQNFIDAVKAALADCRDAQQDKTVIGLAKEIAIANFGAPSYCVVPDSSPQTFPTPVPTQTPSPTPTPTPTTTPTPTPTTTPTPTPTTTPTPTPTPTPTQYTLTITIVGEGSVNKEPVIAQRTTKSKDLDVSYWTPGTIVQLTATPANGWSFAGWSEDLTGKNNPENITMNNNKVVTATFTQNPPTLYTLTINYVYQGGGEAASSHTATLAESDPYNVTSPTIPGFTPDQAVVSGTMPASDVTVTVNYTEPPTNQGCTSGYWKYHTDSWAPTGYDPNQSVVSVFAQSSAYPSYIRDSTLLQALNFGGGGPEGAAELLLRAGVAALLNASHPSVAYPRTPIQVITDVDTALASGDNNTMLTVAAALDLDNNLGCPLPLN